MSHGADSVKSIFYALGANFSIAIAKLAAAIYTGSGAMMAESIHSFADCSNQVLLLFGIKKAKKPPSPDCPLGFGKEIYFWSFIVALILFSMGGLYSMYEGIHKLQHPEPISAPMVAITVLIFAVLAEGASLLGCIKEVNKVRDDRSFVHWFQETRQSDLLVIFGEDTAALVGLSLALIAVILTWLTGNPMWDALGSISIGVLLILVAIFIGIEVKALLIGQGVEPRTKEKMLIFLQERPEIDKIFNLITMQMGNDVMVAIKAKMVNHQSAEEMVHAINHCEVAFKEAFPETMWLFFEPDIKD